MSRDLPEFQMFTAHELAAQRIVRGGDKPSERVYDESKCKVEDGWTYYIEEESVPGVSESPHAVIVKYAGEGEDVVVPEQLGGLPVRELLNQVFARMSGIRKVVIPDTVERVGTKTFFQCANLESVRMSDAISELDPQTFAGCRKLGKIHLPAALAALKRRMLFDCPIEELEVPLATAVVEEQVCNSASLKGVSVADGNAAFSTDGKALFSADGSELISLLVPVEHYEVPHGCKAIAAGAFKGCTDLASIDFGGTLETIGDFAFFRTGISEAVFPESLKSVGASAFSTCANLETVSFNEGLVSISDQAFSRTKLTRAFLPSTLEHLGVHVFEKTSIDFNNEGDFAISESNGVLSSDGKALYRRAEGKLILVCTLCELVEYEVLPGTAEIAASAFEHEAKLERVVLPEGLEVIGDKAFKACDKLTEVVFPQTLELIGDEAFWQTSLAAAAIGPRVKHIGTCAFEVAGASRRHEKRTLRSLAVDPANERYYFEENLLIERNPAGDRALVFVEPKDCVTIPRAVTSICDMCFYHAHVRELRFHSGITHVDPRAMLGVDNIDRVYVEFPHEVEGFDSVVVEFPYQARDMEDFSRPLCMDKDGLFFDFATYDSMVVHEQDPTAVVRMILARFDQPVKLGESDRTNFESALRGLMNAVLRRYAQNNDRAGYDLLFSHGYLDTETLDLAKRIAESEGAQEALAYLQSIGKQP